MSTSIVNIPRLNLKAFSNSTFLNPAQCQQITIQAIAKTSKITDLAKT